MNHYNEIAEHAASLGCKLTLHCPMSGYTSFKTGGPADILIAPDDKVSLVALAEHITSLNTPMLVIGNGTNLLVSDAGIRGAVLVTTRLGAVEQLDDTTLRAECGVSLSRLCSCAHKHGLSGLEFAYGIPGTVGGAVYMNAGAYDGCISDVLDTTECIGLDGQLKIYDNARHEFAYRKSVFQDGKHLILSSTFKLKPAPKEEIFAKMERNMRARIEKQPLEYPSAGSVFKRYPGFYSAQLIDQAGLKGKRMGGAMVSEKHAGFIINADNATSQDIYNLIRLIQDEVQSRNHIRLECEVRMLGDFS